MMKDFFVRWKKGLEALTPIQLLRSQLIMTCTMLIGLVWGCVVMFLMKYWHFLLVLGAGTGLQLISLVSLLKQYWAITAVSDVVAMQELDREFNKMMEGEKDE